MRKALAGLLSFLLLLSTVTAGGSFTLSEESIGTGPNGSSSSSETTTLDVPTSVDKIEIKIGDDSTIKKNGNSIGTYSGGENVTLYSIDSSDTFKVVSSDGGSYWDHDLTGIETSISPKNDVLIVKEIREYKADIPQDIETTPYEKAVSFAGDYWSKPDSLSCTLTYSVAFGDCWVDFGVFTFSDGSKDLFLEDLEANAAIIEEDRKNVISSMSLLNNQSYGISQSGAKIKAIQALNNGTAEATASNNIRGYVEDFWTERQRNLVAQHQLEVQELNQTLSVADSVGVSPSDMFKSNYSGIVITERDYTMVNGSTEKTYGVYSKSGDLLHAYNEKNLSGLETQDGYNFLAGGDYGEKNQQLVELSDQAATATSELVSNIYGNYSEGELTVADNVGPLEETRLLSSNFEDTGATSYLSGTYRQMGFASDFNSSFKISYQNQDMSSSETKVGNLFAAEGDYPNGFTVGSNYSAENKTAYLIYKPDNDPATSLTLDGNFTVKEITDTSTGEQLNSTSIQSSEFYTPDIENLTSQLSEYRDRIDELESSLFSGGAGAGGGNLLGNFGLSPASAVATAVIGGLSLVLLGVFLA